VEHAEMGLALAGQVDGNPEPSKRTFIELALLTSCLQGFLSKKNTLSW
jgi:hypothetical protein